jgi:hypothetical protein
MNTYHFAYAAGALFFALIWAAFYLGGKTRRMAMITMGVIVGIAGALSEYFFIPEYWHPYYVFEFRLNFPHKTFIFGPEDFFYAFFISGIYYALFDVFHNSRKSEAAKFRLTFRGFLRYLAFSGIFLVGLYLFMLKFSVMNSTLLTMVLLNIFMHIKNPGYTRAALLAGFSAGIGYWLVYVLVLVPIFPDSVGLFWNRSGISGIYLAGIPVEEMLYAFVMTVFIGPFYRFVFVDQPDKAA